MIKKYNINKILDISTLKRVNTKSILDTSSIRSFRSKCEKHILQLEWALLPFLFTVILWQNWQMEQQAVALGNCTKDLVTQAVIMENLQQELTGLTIYVAESHLKREYYFSLDTVFNVANYATGLLGLS
jgi:hypothetical protein